MSPERAVPSHDPDMFEDVDSPDQAPPRPSAPDQAAPAGRAPEPPAQVVAPSEPDRPEPVVAAEVPAAERAPEDAKGGRLYRSAGATGAQAARAVPALDRPRAGTAAASGSAAAVAYAAPEPAFAESAAEPQKSGDEAPDWMEEEWPIRPARANPAPVVVVATNPSAPAAGSPPSAAPEWLNPAQPEPQPATHRPQKANLLGRPTFSKGETRRVGDGLLLARDGVTLVGEWVLVGGAAIVGALIDVLFGGALGLWLPLLTFLAATYGALRIKRSEWLMAIVVPPIALMVAGLFIGQLALPSGHHVFTKEVLLVANLLPSLFPWLVAMLLVTGGIAYWRSRAGRGSKVPS